MSNFEGFTELSEYFKEITSEMDNVTDILEIGAQDFVKDLLKLPKPISRIRKSGYTHLVKSFAYAKQEKEVEVGWGKYYGRMVENGTSKMYAREHLNPCFNRNKEKYYKKMIAKLGFET